MMIISTSFSTLIQNYMLWLLFLISIYGYHCKLAGGANCPKEERRALLEFKAGLIDEGGLLSGWNNSSNCCEWSGVGCDNRTNHVVSLDLNSGYESHHLLRGKISPSLLQLHHLEYLDLSANDFYGSTIPYFIGSFTKLQHLNLNSCEFDGPVPHHLGNLSMLKFLDLSYNYFYGIRNIGWFSGFKSLEYLDLRGSSIGSEILEAIHTLPALEQIHLSWCGLTVVEPLWINYSNSLVILDLSSNDIEGGVTNAFRNLSNLSYLDLSFNQLHEDFPSLVTWLQGSTGLEHLALGENHLTGSFPNISRFSALKELYLENTRLSGELGQDSFRLPNLEFLELSNNKFIGRFPNLSLCARLNMLNVAYNKLEGVITEAHLPRHPHLTILDLSFNINLTVRISHSWPYHSQLNEIHMRYCKLGPNFPKWLQNVNKLEGLDISSSGIIDTIPAWFWHKVYWCKYVNMSHNHIYGALPDLSSKFVDLRGIDLSSNEFTGPLPNFPKVALVDFSRNKFSGSILNICKHGHIIVDLDLSNNLLSGEIPQECSNLFQIEYLNLANNNLSGEISTTNHLECRVLSLHLWNNSFKGEIPRSLLNCSELVMLDLGENEFSGEVPGWLGANMPNLAFLILNSNKIHGSLPSSICHLANIQVLDISSNMISGTIPNCINNFTQLSSEEAAFVASRNFYFYHDSASIIWKGVDQTYRNTLEFLKMIDFSSNELTGVIPHEITSLRGLLGLNLSRNNLVGSIPRDIDRMKLLNFLDLSGNNLSGGIPSTLSKLNQLGILNLSFNNLSGRIPWETHMQTFGASTYLGNPELCGPPLLSRPCPSEDHEEQDDDDDEEEEEDQLITREFYVSMLIGFGVAFWVVFWTLFFNKWWNASTTRIYYVVADWLYVIVLVNKRRLMSYLGNA